MNSPLNDFRSTLPRLGPDKMLRTSWISTCLAGRYACRYRWLLDQQCMPKAPKKRA
jgi:hypothetical protein